MIHRGGENDKPWFADKAKLASEASEANGEVKTLKTVAATQRRKVSSSTAKKGKKGSSKRSVSAAVISALKDVYRSHEISPWDTQDGWSAMTSISLGNGGVHGATFRDGRFLTKLNLSSNNLTGSIPPSIAALTEVQYLYLQRNALSGSIPDEVFALSNLKSLILSSNKLEGEIPASLGGCTNLEYLILSDNSLVGEMPTALSQLRCLIALDLSGNRLTGEILRISWSYCTKLETLDLSSNLFTGRLPELSECTNLKTVDVRYNSLEVLSEHGLFSADAAEVPTAGGEEAHVKTHVKCHFLPQGCSVPGV
jgi:hypothetical protein